MPEGAALSWSFSAVVIRRKGRLAFRYRVPGARYSINGRNRRVSPVVARSDDRLLSELTAGTHPCLREPLFMPQSRHCEERSDEAISMPQTPFRLDRHGAYGASR